MKRILTFLTAVVTLTSATFVTLPKLPAGSNWERARSDMKKELDYIKKV